MSGLIPPEQIFVQFKFVEFAENPKKKNNPQLTIDTT